MIIADRVASAYDELFGARELIDYMREFYK